MDTIRCLRTSGSPGVFLSRTLHGHCQIGEACSRHHICRDTSPSLVKWSDVRVSSHGEKRLAVAVTPGDCVVMAVRHLLTVRPDLILSGVNRGANLGLETVFSGTVGATMTSMLLGIRSIGLSQDCLDRSEVPWSNALTYAPQVIQELLGQAMSISPVAPQRTFFR